MTTQRTIELWSIWYPKAAATGLLVARGRLDATDQLLLHAAPPVLSAMIHDEDGVCLASAKDLEATLDSPMTLLRRDGQSISREDLWPDERHLGLPVLLPGGEAGILQSWWHAADRSEWRWQVEFYNQKAG